MVYKFYIFVGLIKKNGIIHLYQMGEVYELYNMEELTLGSLCPHCKKADLEFTRTSVDYHLYLICPYCDSTYTIEG